ncbi:MAG: VIT1/CCC1 transporter family protein [Candidatus Paceibacterota bacterium]
MRHINETLLGAKKLLIRNTIFGVEDSLVSTVGLLSGIAVAGVPTETIILTGIILIFVEALSMGAGSFLSEQSVQEYALGNHNGSITAIRGGIIMFFSYFLAGFIPLSPYLFLPSTEALLSSVGISLLALFLLGAVFARLFKAKIVGSGVRMLVVGGLAILIGILIGGFVQ